MSHTVSTLNIQIDSLLEILKTRSDNLQRDTPLFHPVLLPKERLHPSELGLIRITSWLYVFYFEAGRVNIEFLIRRLATLEEEQHDFVKEHLALVHSMRTYMQHNLDLTRQRDKIMYSSCQGWFAEICGNKEPNTEQEWNLCLEVMLNGAMRLLQALDLSLESIATDDAIDEILVDWMRFQTKRIEPHEFDNLIAIAAEDMGRPALDAPKLRKRFYDRWSKELEALSAGFDLEVEARKLIEHTLLNEVSSVLPITGKDILEFFPTIEPGPTVGKYLEKATELYKAEPCDKEVLIDRLRIEVASHP